jgi:hypothetical protein
MLSGGAKRLWRESDAAKLSKRANNARAYLRPLQPAKRRPILALQPIRLVSATCEIFRTKKGRSLIAGTGENQGAGDNQEGQGLARFPIADNLGLFENLGRLKNFSVLSEMPRSARKRLWRAAKRRG